MSFVFSPIGNGTQFFTPGGLPLSGGFLNTYLAGTTTPTPTWTTSAGNIANTNPIQLGSDGRPPAEIWLSSTVAYKFVLTDSLNNIIVTYDNISGIVNSPTSIWVSSGVTPTFISATQFSVPGNLTALFVPGIRIRYTIASTQFYGSVTSSVFSTLTTVSILADSTPLTSSLNAVDVSQLAPNASAVQTTVAQTTNFQTGATFGNALQTGNTILDWYEENPFTPVLSVSGGTPTATIAGSFTRVGRLVFIDISLSVQSWNGAAGAINIFGLPYVAGNDGMIGGYYGGGSSASINFFGLIRSGTTTINVSRLTGAALLVSDASVVWTMNLSGFYRV